MKNIKYKSYIAVVIMLIVLAATLINSAFYVSASALDTIDLFKNFTSKSVLLMHPDSGTILYAKNENEKMPVASICKLMTSLITLESINEGVLNLDDEVTASMHAASMEGSQAFLDAGSNYKVKDLLKSVIVASANDSAVALAESIAGSEDAFVIKMNKRAKELGMNDTLYANATGLPAVQQYSTASDTAKILREVGKYDLFNTDSKIWMDEFVHPSGRSTELVNTNRLIKYYDKCVNGKTGFTDEAGYCLATTASYKGMDLIAVTLKSNSASNRFKENMELFNYGFANYENKQILTANLAIDKVNVGFGNIEFIEVGSKEDYYIINKKGFNGDGKINIEINKNIKAPINKGDVVGTCLVVQDGKVVAEIELVSLNNVRKQTFKDALNKVIDKWDI